MKKIYLILSPLITTFLLAFLLAKLSFIWGGSSLPQGQLIITARLTKTIVKTCRDYTEEELKTIPTHMRGPQLCEQSSKPYQLQGTIDGQLIADETIRPQTSRGDHPMNIRKVITLNPGEYLLDLKLTPNRADLQSYAFENRVIIEAGKKIFVTLDEDGNKFIIY